MASWLDTACLWMPKLSLRLLPAQQPDIGGGLERKTQRNTFCLHCSPGLTQSSVHLEHGGPGDRCGSTGGTCALWDCSSFASYCMDWAWWALDWGLEAV